VQVCLLFKDNVLEEWYAGLNASDGLTFHGDPSLVMPRLSIRALAMALPSRTDAGGRAATVAHELAHHSGAVQQHVPPTADLASQLASWKLRRQSKPVKERSGAASSRLKIVSRLAASMTHNLALTRLPASGAWLAVGGRHNKMSDHLWPNSPVLRRSELREVRRSRDTLAHTTHARAPQPMSISAHAALMSSP
jgi:hypothetical protein